MVAAGAGEDRGPTEWQRIDSWVFFLIPLLTTLKMSSVPMGFCHYLNTLEYNKVNFA